MTRSAWLSGIALLGVTPGIAAGPEGVRIEAPGDWPRVDPGEALAGLAGGRAGERAGGRKKLRWNYAMAMLGSGRAAEALGPLAVIERAEPDVALVPAFQIAKGRILVGLGRPADAVATLSIAANGGNSEACAWRMRALAEAGAAQPALNEMPCAKAALALRSPGARTPFLIAAARAALARERGDAAIHWLRFAAQGNAEVRLLRGKALLAAGQAGAAAREFVAARASGRGEVAASAEVGRIEAELLLRRLAPAKALEAARAAAYRWRGGPVERDALLLAFRLARGTGNDVAALATAATLIRFHVLGPLLAPLLAQAQGVLGAMLAPASRRPLDQVAGLYWEYRDLAPSGAEGDALAMQLAERLQEASLYARAADLMEHQLVSRARDLAQGPLSVRVAKLHILAGQPQRALDALKLSDQTLYPAYMYHDRERVEAIALQLLGRGREALAVLAMVPGSGPLQAELLWKQRSWAALADLAGRNLPPAGSLSQVRQAVILRHAITLGMLGREDALAALRQRYEMAFAPLATAGAFDLLTRPATAVDPEALAQAMAAIPAVSPAGDFADLLDAAPVPAKPARAGS